MYLFLNRQCQKNITAKFNLTRKLYDYGLDRDTILNLYKFLDWVLTLPEALEIRYTLLKWGDKVLDAETMDDVFV